jgi:site-specific recombinase XerC
VRALRGDPKKKPSAIDSIESTLRIHLLPFVGGLRLDMITNEVVDALATRWSEGAYEYIGQHGHVRMVVGTRSQKTHGNRRTVLRSCLLCAVKWGRIATMPASIAVPQVKSDEAAYHDFETCERLVAAAATLDPTTRVAVLLGVDAGLRRGEIIALKAEDIDWRLKRVVVRHNVYWKRNVCVDVAPKGGIVKPVPCTPRLMGALRAVSHERGGRLLQTSEGQPLTPPMLRRRVMQAEERAGMPRTGRIHILRHTFCSLLAAAGVPARAIQELARHKDLATTLRYMHLSPNATEQGIAMLERFRARGGTSVLYALPAPTTAEP